MASHRRLFRFSLRALLVVLTAVAVGFGWLRYRGELHRAALDAIRQAGGEIRMSSGPPSMLERWLGSDSFGKVQAIDLREGEVDNDLMSQIAAISELRDLDLSGADIDDEGLKRIEHLPLSNLWIQSTNISDASADTLSQMQSLSFLQLNATKVGDEFLQRLEPLPYLRDFGLRGTRVTSEGMQYLPRHTRLKDLDVYSTEVGDAGVEWLVPCQELVDLGLSMTKVTDDVFKSLAKLPNLTNVDLTANRPVTKEAVQGFQKSNPKCNVESW